MSDASQVPEAVDTAVKAGGGGLLVLFFTRLFKSGDSLAMLMAQNAALDATLKTMIADVAALKSDVRQMRERMDAAFASHRARLDGLESGHSRVRLELGLVEKTHEISELKAELDATKKE